MHCLVFTDTDLSSLTKGKSYLAKQKWRRSTCLRDQCYDVGCHPCIEGLQVIISKTFIYFYSLNIYLVLANSTYPDEMQHYAVFHLGLYCLPKYPLLGVSSIQRV